MRHASVSMDTLGSMEFAHILLLLVLLTSITLEVYVHVCLNSTETLKEPANMVQL